LVLMGVASVSVMEGVKVVPSVTVPLMLAVVVPLLLLAGALSLLRTLGVILPTVTVLLRLLGFGMVLLFDTVLVLIGFGVDVFTGVVLLAFGVLFDTLLEPVALLDVADSLNVTLTEAQND